MTEKHWKNEVTLQFTLKYVAEKYVRDYGFELLKKQQYRANDEPLREYGYFYKFCLDCHELEECPVAKLLKANPQYVNYGNLKMTENIKAAHELFMSCPYRKIALNRIERAKKKYPESKILNPQREVCYA